VGAILHSSTSGALVLLPPLRIEGIRHDRRTGEIRSSEKARTLGKRLAACVGALADSLKEFTQHTPSPVWVLDSQFRLARESEFETAIAQCTSDIGALQATKLTLETSLRDAGKLRMLLFEQGRPLEVAILEALRLFGFTAQPFSDGESEFDAVFVSPEGRCLGEAEGKDNRAVNIDKFSQLERNLQEDFARDEVTQFAKGVLFGNAYRLLSIEERKDFFTEKCVSAARRVGVALVRTPDLFAPAKYLQEHETDTTYAKRCREAIFQTSGEIVVFPVPPVEGTTAIAQSPKTE
jgi:hypothetical protein